MTVAEFESTLADRGWLVLDLPDPATVFLTRDRLLNWLRECGLPDLSQLEDYHLLVNDDDHHVELIYNLAKLYWEAELGRAIIASNLDLFRELVGADLMIQRRPYLRAVRPNKYRDAAPLHRDTYYGASSYEVSIVVPFTDMDANAALRVISGSHLAPDSDYPYSQQVSEDVTIRSSKHKLGFPYAPRILAPELAQHTQPVPIAVGQVLIFGLSLIHGSGVNIGSSTRFSTDIRLANSLAPVQWHRGVDQNYLVPLSTSVISRTAQHYIQINTEQKTAATENSMDLVNTNPTGLPLDIKSIDPTQDPAWLTLLTHPEAGIFHSPPWLRALSDAYGFVIRAYVATEASNSILGGILFCEIDDLIGHRITSLPFTDVCDPLVTSRDVWPLLLTKLQSHKVPLELRCLRDSVATDDQNFQVTRSKRWHHLSIEDSPELLWSRIASPHRRAIRAAEKAGVEVRPLMGTEGWEGFLRLHIALRKQKFGLLAQPSRFFEALAQRFGEVNGWYPLGAFLDGHLIAATIYLRWGETLYYKFSASDLNSLKVRPNNLLTWAGISLGQSLGCRVLDLGPSDDDQPGLIRFKRNFGAEERELRFLRWTPPEFPQKENAEVRQLLRDLTSLLTTPDIPDEVAKNAGALLYRFFA